MRRQDHSFPTSPSFDAEHPSLRSTASCLGPVTGSLLAPGWALPCQASGCVASPRDDGTVACCVIGEVIETPTSISMCRVVAVKFFFAAAADLMALYRRVKEIILPPLQSTRSRLPHLVPAIQKHTRLEFLMDRARSTSAVAVRADNTGFGGVGTRRMPRRWHSRSFDEQRFSKPSSVRVKWTGLLWAITREMSSKRCVGDTFVFR